MGRIFGTIRVDGKNCRALFDSGARNTYLSHYPEEFTEFAG